MQLCIDETGNPGGHILPIPESLTPFIIPAALTVFRKQHFGWTLIQTILFPQGEFMSWRIRVHDTVTLFRTNHQPFLAWHGLAQGSLIGELQGYGQIQLQEGESRLFYLPAGMHRAHFTPGDYESILIALPLADMQEAAQLYPPIHTLLHGISGASRQGRPLDPVPMDFIVYRVLDDLRSFPGLPGPSSLQFRKASLELLLAYLRKVPRHRPNQAMPAHPYFNLMLSIRAEIEAVPNVREHSIYKTARRFLVSETILKRSFRSLFGQSFAQFVRAQALEKAHYFIRTSTLPMEDIAEMVGYRSLKSFTVAFRQRFGYAPVQLRQRGIH